MFLFILPLSSKATTFFSPVDKMKLVEVIPTDDTDAAVTAETVSFVESIGKTPVLVKDSTGFIVNRLLTPYMCDAVRALESGLADIAGIDTAMQLGANHPMGPLALADYIGLDIVCAMAENLHASFGQDYMAPPATIKRMVEAGTLGRKTKLGGWYYVCVRPGGMSGEDLNQWFGVLMDQEIKTDPAEVAVAGSPAQCADRLRAYIDAGVEHFVLDMQRHGLESVESAMEQMTLFAEEVVPLI